MPLAKRHALVTGSTSGTGLALAKEGADVMINGMGDPAAIENERSAIEIEFGVNAFYDGADMSKPAEIAGIVLGESVGPQGLGVYAGGRRLSRSAQSDQRDDGATRIFPIRAEPARTPTPGRASTICRQSC